jgi:uroporphyrinogen-III synthase
MRIIVTRPRAQAELLVAELQRTGIDALALPLIDIAAVRDPLPLQQAWKDLPQFALLMFVSANAVQQFMRHRPAQAAWPAQVLAGSTGPGTSTALRRAGVPPQALVEPAGTVFDSEALWQRLAARDWSGRRVLVVRGESGRDWLAERFGQAGARVDFLAAYERRLPQPDAPGQALLDAAQQLPWQHLWVFSSSEAAANLALLAPGADWTRAAAIAPHERIVAAVRQLGFGRVDLVAANAAAVARAVATFESRSIQSHPP